MEEFEKEEESIFPPTVESLVEFLSKKQKVEKEVMLCPRYNTIFDKLIVKAFKASQIQKSFQKVQERGRRRKRRRRCRDGEKRLRVFWVS